MGSLPASADNHARRRAAVALVLALAALCGLAVIGDPAPAQDPAEIQAKADELEGVRDRQGDLEAEVERTNAEVDDLIAREADVREREDAVAAELSATQARLDEATAEVESERRRLAQLREQLTAARKLLAEVLVRTYKSQPPDTLSIILESASWSDVLAEAEYLNRIENYDAAVIERVDTLVAEVTGSVERLESARERIEDDRDAAAAQRDELAGVQDELESQHAELVAAREERRSALRELQGRERRLEKDVAAGAEAPGAAPPGVAPPGGATASLVDGLAVAPANAPPAVKSAIEAANRIVGRPYVWGGGHGSFESSGYDCSGAVSYALHGGGFLASPLDSTALMTWGSPGAGSWITVYAHSGHTYVVIAGLRFDTSGTEGGSGPSWSTEMRSPGGFVARHPDGY